MSVEYRLPNGKKTQSLRGYTRAWRSMARALQARLPGFKVISYGPLPVRGGSGSAPGFLFQGPDDRDHFVPVVLAKALIDNTLARTLYPVDTEVP
jgi:hypothetical protein